MKKIICLGFFAFSFLYTSAQINDPNDLRSGLVVTKAKPMTEVEGSPYLNETFAKGEVSFDENKSLEVYLRYNVLHEEMEIKLKPEDSEIYMLPDNKNVEYSLEGQLFRIDKIHVDGEKIDGFFQELFSGEELTLLMKAIAEVSDPVIARNSYQDDKPASVRIQRNYFVVFKKGGVEEVRIKRRDLKKVFNSVSAKEYLKNNRIRSEDDLVEFVKYQDEHFD